MLRVCVVTQDQWDYIWSKIMPMQRRSVEWVGADSLVLTDSDGPILVTIATVSLLGTKDDLPDRVQKYMAGFENHVAA